ncbi:Shedu anti-phage system protein SduA domain-containing protein [Aquimarina sp. AU58]|uniref:Shedu anti-phage system protein SduA domain-containing protein n=1 Tax=Aquimarina sp. AU58 TaxID=1874112 RepID=UPI000D6E32D4|nr:Shedu anti-phage system protein SduA domain-containing protein [Aquimarina sp. AU58]
MSTWNILGVEKKLKKAFDNNSEVELLSILKENSFLFYEFYSRKGGALPNFSEVSFGRYRCDFTWLNDNSGGPEWVLVEVEKPKMRLFTKKKEPTAELNHALEQVRSWDKYFKENPTEKKRIFGAVSKFRYILIGGLRRDWHTENAIKWRAYQNKEFNIEIRSIDSFLNSLESAKKNYGDFWSFEENPKSLKDSDLEKFWKEYGYMEMWRRLLN